MSYTQTVGERKNWHFHNKLKWTIVIESIKWYGENVNELHDWMRSEDILEQNVALTYRIYLYSAEQATYFKMRWG